MIKVYNKLVRDRIPEIIEASGAECKTEILSDEKYLEMIDAKLDEELAEYHKDQNLEELADCAFWLAMYTDWMRYEHRFLMWQYSNQGKVPGIETAVDMNLWFPE